MKPSFFVASFGAAIPLLGGCLRGDVEHRPFIEGTVTGEVTFAGGCTATKESCDRVFPVTVHDGRFAVEPLTETVTLALGADPWIGWSVLWVCGPDGMAGAVVAGAPTTGNRATVALPVSAEVPIAMYSGMASGGPSEADARRMVREGCGKG